MKFKLKAIVAAVALAAAGHALADIQPGNLTSGANGGELVFYAFDDVTKTSYVKDLGVTFASFLGNANYNNVFTGGTVLGNISSDANWTAYLGSVANNTSNTLWGVFDSLKTGSTGANTQQILTTARNNTTANTQTSLTRGIDSIFNTNWGNFSVKTWSLHPLNSRVNYIFLYESIGASVGFFGYNSFEGIYQAYLASYCIGTDSACGFSCNNPLLGIKNLTSSQNLIHIFPDPARDILNVQLMNINLSNNTQFVIIDLLGREVRRETLLNLKTQVDVSAFLSGIYLWHLVSDYTIIGSGKFVHE